QLGVGEDDEVRRGERRVAGPVEVGEVALGGGDVGQIRGAVPGPAPDDLEQFALVPLHEVFEHGGEQLLLGGEVIHQSGFGDAGRASGGLEGEVAAGTEMDLRGREHRLSAGGAVRWARGAGGHALTLPTGW